MSTLTSITIVPTTSFGNPTGNYDGLAPTFSSDKHKGDGWYGMSDGVHTVQINTTNFIGDIKIQATLVTAPIETDWADTTAQIIGDGVTQVTNKHMLNFTGNYVWVRASISNFIAGSIDQIILAH